MRQHYLAEWFEWFAGLESGGIGYPSSYDLTIPRGGGLGKTIVPQVQPPKHLLEIDGAMRVLARRHRDHWSILVTRHAEPGTESEKALRLGMSRANFQFRVRCAESWLDGYLCRPS